MSGHSTTVSRDMRRSVEEAYALWASAEGMDKWFSNNTRMDFGVGGRFENQDKDVCVYIEIEPNRKIVFEWKNPQHTPGSYVTVLFESLEEELCRVTITHDSLATSEEAENLKQGWSWALDSMKSCIETGARISYDDWESRLN